MHALADGRPLLNINCVFLSDIIFNKEKKVHALADASLLNINA